MVRKIVQLTEAQSKALAQRAKQQGVSTSELVRQGVDMVLSTRMGDAEARKRAVAAAGCIRDVPDLATNHDRYLAEAYNEHLR